MDNTVKTDYDERGNPQTEEATLYYVCPPKIGDLFTKEEAMKAMRMWHNIQSFKLKSRIKELESENEELRKKIERDNDRLKGYTD